MILVDGTPGQVPADDRGLAYGDGVFETLRARRGRLPLLAYHLERLHGGLAALQIPPPPEHILRDELLQAAMAEPEGVVKLIVTRGSGGRGYRAPQAARARRIIQASAAPARLAELQRGGVTVCLCRTRLEGPAALAGFKHLNRLPQVLARAEWTDPGIHEGLMRDADGCIVEGTHSNLFLRVGNQLVTPPVGAGVRGVMRRLVLELARRYGIETIERHVSDAEFETADELFLANSLMAVCPVRQVEDRPRSIGTMTRLLQKEIEAELERRAC